MSQTEPRRISIELPVNTALEIESWLRYTSDEEPYSSNGRLDLEGLTRMLLEDAYLATKRPGSWESDFMLQLLRGHGYNPLELQAQRDDP